MSQIDGKPRQGSHMQKLLEASQTAQGRHMLLSTGELTWLSQQAAALLSDLVIAPHADADSFLKQHPELLLLLRTLRNSCALGAPAAAVLLQEGVHTSLSSAMSWLSTVNSALQQTVGSTVAVRQLTGCTGPCKGQLQHHQQQQPQPLKDAKQCHKETESPLLQPQHHTLIEDEHHLQDLLRAAAQLLSNLACSGSAAAAAVWGAAFPTALNEALVTDDGRVHEAVALTVLSCSKTCSNAQHDLISTTAHTFWKRLLEPLMPQHTSKLRGCKQTEVGEVPCAPGTPTASVDVTTGANLHAGRDACPEAVVTSSSSTSQRLSGNDNVCMLVKHLAMQHNQLRSLMKLLVDPSGPHKHSTPASKAAGDLHAFTEQHAVLLHIIALEAAAVPADVPLPGVPVLTHGAQSSNGSTTCAADLATGTSKTCYPEVDPVIILSSWLQYTVDLLPQVWAEALAGAKPTPGVCSSPSLTGHLLEAVLLVLKAVLSRDESDGTGHAGKAAAAAAATAGLIAVAQHLYDLGLLQQLINMLKALGTPPKAKLEQQRQEEQQQQQQQLPPQGPQHEQPYAGYRADVVAVLSNMLLGGSKVQQAVMQAGGMELLLSNCNLDESSPLAREWALWGVRNACNDNPEVQQYVAQFQAVDAVQTPELDKMGMQLELDQMTHKLKLSPKTDGM